MPSPLALVALATLATTLAPASATPPPLDGSLRSGDAAADAKLSAALATGSKAEVADN